MTCNNDKRPISSFGGQGLRRPILFIAAAYAAGIAFQYVYQFNKITLWIALMLSFIVLFVRVHKKDQVIYWLCIIVFLGSTFFYMIEHHHSTLEKYNHSEMVIEGYIVSVSQINPSFHRIVVKADRVYLENGDKAINEKVLVNLAGNKEKIYKWVGHKAKINGKVYQPSANRNPKTFNYRMYLKSKKIHMIMDSSIQKIKIDTEDVKKLHYLLAQFKYTFIDKTMKVMSIEKAGVLAGIMFGDKNYIDGKTYENFQRNGTAHILAVSGIHIGILYSVLEVLLKKYSNSLLKDIVVVLILFVYAALSEFSPSVMRAVIMIILFIISKRCYRRYDFLSSAGFVAFILLLYNPYILFNVGFQLSFAAVFSLGSIYPFIDRKVKLDHSFFNIMKALAAIQIGTAPLIAYHFNYFSLNAFIINIPIMLFAGMILPTGFVLLLSNFISDKAFFWISQFEEMLINTIIQMNYLATKILKDGWDVVSPPVIILILFYFIIYFFSLEMLPQKVIKSKKQIFVFTGILIVICWIAVPKLYGKYEVIFVDVGQGDCIHIRTPQGENILVDGGGSLKGNDYDVGKKVLLPYLLKNGVGHIDLAIITHLDADHYKGVTSVMKDLQVSNIALFQGTNEHTVLQNIQLLCAENNSKLTFVKKSDKIHIDDSITINVLYPEKGLKGEEENNNSLVLLLEYRGHKILLTGDIEKEAEAILIKENKRLHAEVLKVPHHGSQTSSTLPFIQAVKPLVGIIQVGENAFGHPDSEILKRYENEHVKILRTDRDGAILLDIKENKIHIETVNGDEYEL